MSIFDTLLNFIASGLDFSNFNPLVLLPLLGMYGGGGGGQQAKAPELNVGKSLALSKGQIEQLINYAPEVASVLGATSRDQSALNTLYGVDLLTDPKSTLRQAARDDIRINKQDDIQKLNKSKANQTKAGTFDQAKYDQRLAAINKKYDKQLAGVKDINPLADLKSAFKSEYKQRDQLIQSARDSIASTSEYKRLQKALGKGTTARTTEAGALGDSLMATAMEKVQQGGNLSAEAERDAIQQARASYAARGLGTGASAAAAELLNRDRFSRQREAENLAFASGVQTQDLARRQTNAAIQADTDRYNLGLLGQSSSLADAERARQLGTRQDIYNFSMSTNPRMMLAGVGSPYANMTQPTIGQLGAITSGVQPVYTGGQFSGGDGGWLNRAITGATIGASQGSVGGIWGAVGGAAGGAIDGAANGPIYRAQTGT
ncbi:MAG: hypothetical protein ACO3GP_04815 [Candidatus Limnocylindrus sp.]